MAARERRGPNAGLPKQKGNSGGLQLEQLVLNSYSYCECTYSTHHGPMTAGKSVKKVPKMGMGDVREASGTCQGLGVRSSLTAGVVSQRGTNDVDGAL